VSEPFRVVRASRLAEKLASANVVLSEKNDALEADRDRWRAVAEIRACGHPVADRHPVSMGGVNGYLQWCAVCGSLRCDTGWSGQRSLWLSPSLHEARKEREP
jgi:hypothetical protein